MKQKDLVQNAKYPEGISELRRPIESPTSIVDSDGNVNFGTFLEPIENLNIIDAKCPINKVFTKFINSQRIKEWEAFEISFDEGFVVGAIYDVGIMYFNVIIFYDKRTNTVKSNQYIKFGTKKVVKDSLCSTIADNQIKGFNICIKNDFKKGKCCVFANCPKSKKGVDMWVNCELNSIAQPSVAVMPLGDNRPLYSQKELFSVKGSIVIDGEEFTMNENTLAIIDDHKGYYPFKMHYDWITGLGRVDGKVVGFNLTANQVVDKYNYNENYLWLDGDMHPLPDIKIQKVDKNRWICKDEFDMVNIEFNIKESFYKTVGTKNIGADYRAPFGYISGYIKDIFGNKINIENIFGMGEDKSYQI